MQCAKFKPEENGQVLVPGAVMSSNSPCMQVTCVLLDWPLEGFVEVYLPGGLFATSIVLLAPA